MTHPFHPLAGQRLAVLFERSGATGRLYVCEGGPIGTVGLPAAWTSLGGEPAAAPLSYEVLAELAEVIAAIASS